MQVRAPKIIFLFRSYFVDIIFICLGMPGLGPVHSAVFEKDWAGEAASDLQHAVLNQLLAVWDRPREPSYQDLGCCAKRVVGEDVHVAATDGLHLCKNLKQDLHSKQHCMQNA